MSEPLYATVTGQQTFRPISVLPVLRAADLLPARKALRPGILGVGRPLLLNSGAAAISWALRCTKIGEGDTVLLPAFNCPSMVKAVISAGAIPRYYSVAEDLSIPLESVASQLDPRTRAVIAPHLFTWMQDLRPLRDYCETRGLLLIEDCAHAPFGVVDGIPVGSTGHVAIASPRKFFPLREGGLLTAAARDFPLPAEAASWALSARLAFDGVDAAVQSGWLPFMRPPVRFAKILGKRRVASGQDDPKDDQDSTPAVDGQIDVRRAAAPTRWLLRKTLANKALLRREANYRRLKQQLQELDGGHFFESLNSLARGAVPYMALFELDDPDRQFSVLHRMGLPMWRWEYSARGVCAVADRFARSLIQLPCHQAMRNEDIDRMVERFQAGLRS